MQLPEKMTYGEAYDPAMKITNKEDADAYLQALIDRQVRYFDQDPAEAESIVKSNIGYWSGYYDRETMIRVQELFDCSHPLLGKAKDKLFTPEEIFQLGIDHAKNIKKD